MYPGPNDTDWQVAKFQHRERVAMGQHQQCVASVLATKTNARPVSPAARRHLATLLARVGQRLEGAQAVAKESGVSAASIELGTSA